MKEFLTRFLLIPFLYFISILPFWVLYGLSDFLYFVFYYVVGYRKKVVMTNLRNSFPEKSQEELKLIAKKFYKHLTDLTLETIKGATISKKELLKRMRIRPPSYFEVLYKKNTSCIVFMSHYNNWEWVCDAADISAPQKAQCVYKPLSNRAFEKFTNNIRTRFGTRTITMNDTLRVMLKYKNECTATAFISDQAPANPTNSLWISFMGQDTPFMTGAEKIGSKLNCAALYLHVIKVKRGYYECEIEVFADNIASHPENEITSKYVSILEKEIREKPEFWIWSHRRWKHSREN